MHLSVSRWTIARLIALVLIILPLAGHLTSNANTLMAAPAAQGGSTRLYLPVTKSPTVLPATNIFGAETTSLGSSVLARSQEANLTWIRYNGIRWDQIEAQEGVRNWALLDSQMAGLTSMSNRGLTPIVIVRGVPTWAQSEPNLECGLIRQDKHGAFASFMHDVVYRYSQAPYNVRHWEIGNEPDVSLIDLGGDSSWPFGCWGIPGEPYYGGKQYGDMLARVYPSIKAANPNAKVLIGGLLLNCDPAAPPAGSQDGCAPSRFLEGILQAANGAQSFDMVSFHAYTYWNTEDLDWDMGHLSWRHRTGRGLLMGKVDFIRETLARYGTSKPIILTEGGLLCYPNASNQSICPEPFRDDQANYAVRLYSRSWAVGLSGALWYTLNGPGWREGGMLDAANAPRPAFLATKFFAGTLEGATYLGTAPIQNGEGYLFRKGGSTYHVYWSNLRSFSYNVPMPAGTVAVFNKYGQGVPSPGGVVNVSFQPVIIETRP